MSSFQKCQNSRGTVECHTGLISSRIRFPFRFFFFIPYLTVKSVFNIKELISDKSRQHPCLNDKAIECYCGKKKKKKINLQLLRLCLNINTIYSPLRNCSKVTLANQMFTTVASAMHRLNVRSLAETLCREMRRQERGSSRIDRELPLAHIFLSVQ